MLWKICLKRFRWFIYCLILAVLFALPAASDGESGGAFGAIAFFIFVPAAFVTFVWAAYAAVRDIINVRKGGVLPEDKPSVVSTAAGKLRDEAAVVNELDSHGRAKYFILRILGVLLAVGGIALIIKDAVVIGTIVLIAGGALWIAASPKSFNETTDGMKMVTCPKEMTIEELYRGIRGMSTALGAPYIGRVRTIPGDTILFGTRRRRLVCLCLQVSRRQELLCRAERLHRDYRDARPEPRTGCGGRRNGDRLRRRT